MLIVVNSMPKSGSTWLHNYVVRCLCRIGQPTPHAALAGAPVTLNHRANPGALSGATLATLLNAARRQTFAVKTHVSPNDDLLAALTRGQARMIFLIRHPADIVASALAYGEFCRAAGWDEPYRDMYEPRHAADFVARAIGWAAAWRAADEFGSVTRYEELFASDQGLCAALHRLEPQTATVSAEVLAAMRPDALTQAERAWLRVNLVRRPQLDATTFARCQQWAQQIGYSTTGMARGNTLALVDSA